tara:strand:+ start:37 stop:996 length:960 start_codon:yes stop_codon:yes gene_type:complete
MRNLNLTDVGKSDIKYEISKFPDGQQQVKILPFEFIYYPEGSTYFSTGSSNFRISKEISILIQARLNNFKDLELIICATKSLRELGIKKIHLYTPYFLGSRSDRKFEEGSNNYLKDVICPIINSLKFDSVTVLDPHSDVLEACLNNFKKGNNYSLVRSALNRITNPKHTQKQSLVNFIDKDLLQQFVLVSPDAGAYKKIFDVAKEFNIDKIITANKVRDLQSGNIIRTEVPTLDQHEKLKYVIIDDICDGGKTFIELAKAIKMSRPTAQIYLIVTHGIFSKGFDELNKYIEGIYCTNSYRDVADDEYGVKTNTKQLNIF